MTERRLSTDGVELSLVDEGNGPLVVLAHGFPELAFSWRHQIPALVGAGYRVMAPDQRGYGASSRPSAVEEYDILHLTADLIALLDDAGEQSAVFVGHDWGAIVVWTLALLHPERVRGVVGMSVPYLPRGPIPPTQLMAQIFGSSFFYILYFQPPGVADAELGRDPRTTMRRLLAATTSGIPDPSTLAADGRGFVERLPEPDHLPDWLTEDELDRYVAEFTRTGFTGGLNWYRNLDRNWELTPQLAGAKVAAPALFIAGGSDPVLAMSPPSIMDGQLEDPRGNVIVDGAGHWVQQEKPAEVNRALLEFLAGLDDRQGGRQCGPRY